MEIFAKFSTLEQAHWKDLVQDTGNLPAGMMREGLKSPESESGTGGNGECPKAEADESRTRGSREVLRNLTAKPVKG